MPSPEIQILLSTFNGERYIQEQIESILSQTANNWQLLIRDDGSTDNTNSIISNFCIKHPSKIKLIKGGDGGNAASSFMSMLAFTESPYVMFCDQDDVWLSNKVEDAFHNIVKLEKQNPIALYFTDMIVVDEKLKELSPSFFSKQKLNPHWSQNANYVFAQSVAAGCTMIFTQELVRKLHPIKSPLFQHDHWMMMHATYYGGTSYSLEKTVLYRQHESNVVGSHKVNTSYFLSKISNTKLLYQRWQYIKEQFGNEVSVVAIMKAKLAVSRQRV